MPLYCIILRIVYSVNYILSKQNITQQRPLHLRRSREYKAPPYNRLADLIGQLVVAKSQIMRVAGTWFPLLNMAGIYTR